MTDRVHQTGGPDGAGHKSRCRRYQGLTVSGMPNEEHLVVSWDPPVDPPGASVTTFRLEVSENEKGPFIKLPGAEAI